MAGHMGWIKWTGKTMEFLGKLAQQDSFERWAESQGEKIVEKVGLEAGGYAFGMGKDSKAKKILWKDLESLAKESPELRGSIEEFVASYPKTLNRIAGLYTQLPNRNVDLCAVPRFIVNRESLKEAQKQLAGSQELAKLKGGSLLIQYFLEELVSQLDDVFTTQAGKATPEKPIELENKWIVGFSPKYEWHGGPGHYFVYSSLLRTTTDATKARKKEGRKEAREKLDECLKWLGALPQSERDKLEAKFP